jgi:transposase-like protein
VDVLLREHRDLASARAFFDQAIARRGARPKTVVTDKPASYRRAVHRRTWRARHIRTGLHRARGETTKSVERSHVPVKDRLRPMRGLHSIATGQQLLEGIELVQAIRRGHVRANRLHGSAGRSLPPHERAREAADTFLRLARASACAA